MLIVTKTNTNSVKWLKVGLLFENNGISMNDRSRLQYGPKHIVILGVLLG